MNFIEKIKSIFNRNSNSTLPELKEIFDPNIEKIDISNLYKTDIFIKLLVKYDISYEIKTYNSGGFMFYTITMLYIDKKDVSLTNRLIEYFINYYNPLQYFIDMDTALYSKYEIAILNELGFCDTYSKIFYTIEDDFYYEILPCNNKQYKLSKYTTIHHSWYRAYPIKDKLIEETYFNNIDDLSSSILRVLRNLKQSKIGVDIHTT